MVKRLAPRWISRRGDTSVPSSGGIAKNILASIVGVIATVVVGDLIIKRNYEAAIAEFKIVDASIVQASSEFDDLAQEIDNLIRARRSASQQLSRYATDKKAGKFAAYYDEQYTSVVSSWNISVESIRNRIWTVTGCQQASNTVKEAILELIDTEKFAALEASGIGNPSCPDSYLFGLRRSDGKAPEHFSVFQVFRYMDVLLADSRQRDIVQCEAAAVDLKEKALRLCRPLTVRFGPHRASFGVDECLQGVTIHYAVSKLCPSSAYKELADFAPYRFEALDFWWQLGRKVLRFYRPAYVAARCQLSEGVWSQFRPRRECHFVK